MSRKKVLVLGQTPPPYGGQAVMIQQLLNCKFDEIDFFHVRMAFSEDMDSIGRFKIRKVLHLVEVLLRVFLVRILKRPDVLYYPPAGPDRIPFFRDAVVLISCRWMFRFTIFHFHASGISMLYDDLGTLGKRLFRLAYWKPDVAIRTSSLNPDDGKELGAMASIVIENGLPEEYPRFEADIKSRFSHQVPVILYVGALYESKGISILVDACRMLKESGQEFQLICIGRFESDEFEKDIRKQVNDAKMLECVSFPGVLIGDRKWRAYATADIFCFPTYFESESFGLVNIEAMQFRLPVVSTYWRGIPSVVDEGKSGFLVEIKNVEQTAERLNDLIDDADLRVRMGECGWKIYKERYSAETWSAEMSGVFSNLDS